MAARVAAVGRWRCAWTSDARSPAAHPEAAATSRVATPLYQRAGIVFAKQVRIVMGQRPHQLEMQVVHHARAGREELLAKNRPRVIDPLAEGAVHVAARASGLHRR